jgi:hypothetical protein
MIQRLIDELLVNLVVYLAPARRFLSVTHQTHHGRNGAESSLQSRRSLQPSIGFLDRHLSQAPSFEHADDDITRWPGSRLLPMR